MILLLIILINIYFSCDILVYAGITDWLTLSYLRSILVMLMLTITLFEKKNKIQIASPPKLMILFFAYLIIQYFLPSNITTNGRYINAVLINIIFFYFALLNISKKTKTDYDINISKLLEINLIVTFIIALIFIKQIDFANSRIGEYDGTVFSQSAWSRLGCLISAFSLINLIDNNKRYFSFLLFICGLAIMYLSFSKTQIIAFPIILLSIFFFKYHLKLRFLITILISILFVYFSYDYILVRFNSFYSVENIQTLTGRTMIWEKAWSMILQNKEGYGFCTDINLGFIGNSTQLTVQAHNVILQLLLQIGFIGTALLLINYFRLISIYSKILWQEYSTALMRNYAVLIFIGINGIGLSSFALSGSFELIILLLLLASPKYTKK